VLKSRARLGFYVGGKECLGLSVNESFFGVNIDPFIRLPIRTDETDMCFSFSLIY